MAAVAVQNGHALNGTPDYDMEAASGAHMRFSTGLILPPPEIKCALLYSSWKNKCSCCGLAVIDRTASFVARSANPPQFEERVREGQRSDPKFSFLNPADPYHAYYLHRKERVSAGDVEEDGVAKTDKPDGEEVVAEPVDVGIEPPAPDFIIDLPNINPADV